MTADCDFRFCPRLFLRSWFSIQRCIAFICTHCSTLLKCGFPKKKFFVENRLSKKLFSAANAAPLLLLWLMPFAMRLLALQISKFFFEKYLNMIGSSW
ncbi:MAG: hypothetical protein C0507_24730 [Cyanobacteria bacterium PR.3.49]|nr:hypothetical protein [Cyanobacteria bacterium PR.3.49]